MSVNEFENTLRNGVLLAKLSNAFAREVVPLKRIYDIDQAKYKVSDLKFIKFIIFNLSICSIILLRYDLLVCLGARYDIFHCNL